MCLIVFSWNPGGEMPLLLAANRDEFYARPTLPAGFWEEAPHILAGKDLEAGGTWLGVTRGGRWAALTNYRNLKEPLMPDAVSRGSLVSEYLQGSMPPEEYMALVSWRGNEFNGFNLLVGDTKELWYASNKAEGIVRVPAGIHGLSNHLLNTPWPKLELAKDLFSKQIEKNASFPALLDVMHNTQRPDDSLLPSTGVTLEWERMLSSMFITSEKYGTRCSTALSISKNGRVKFLEKTYFPEKGVREYEW